MTLSEPDTVQPDQASQALLDGLGDPDRPLIAADDVAVIVAHPDDETIGCGAQLRRLDKVSVILVTNGAPRGGGDARAHGYASVDSYAAARTRELCSAMALAGVPASRIIELGFSDQAAALHLLDLARSIYFLLAARSINVVLTHAFEGGHPDHDATAFAVHTVAALRRRHSEKLGIIEMPFYHAENNGWATQNFSRQPDCPEVTTPLNRSERELKRRMLAAHATQRATLSAFHVEAEYFRRAPAYDFLSLPNQGQLLYERYDWGLTGKDWLALSRAALGEMGLAGDQWL
jgi:N-acetylglucosamine malate deacetylase 2